MPAQYRLTIEGDERLMQQMAQAFELQGRLCLGQFEEVGAAFVLAVQENTLDKGLALFTSEGDDKTRADAARRWDALVEFKDKLSVLWRQARAEWDTTFHRSPLEAVSPHLSRRERRAYTLRKWMEYHLLHLSVTEENHALLRGSVHYDVPMLRVLDITVNFERINTIDGNQHQ